MMLMGAQGKISFPSDRLRSDDFPMGNNEVMLLFGKGLIAPFTQLMRGQVGHFTVLGPTALVFSEQ